MGRCPVSPTSGGEEQAKMNARPPLPAVVVNSTAPARASNYFDVPRIFDLGAGQILQQPEGTARQDWYVRCPLADFRL
jgi:hypothetical protein